MLIKKTLSFLLISVVLLFCFPFSSFGVDVSAQSAVVLNAETGEVLFEKNAFEKRSMASTTKIMTAILAVESGRLGSTVEITPEMTKAEGTSIGLKVGYKITLLNLVYGMMLESGNDAADAAAVFLAGSLKNFALLMNKKAAEIGMKNTNFVTPSGLDDEEHYSTAYDMALLASYCVKNPLFCSICSTGSLRVDLEEPEMRLYFSNHNRLLKSVDGVFGVKTGFTKKSGRCLVSAIKQDGAVLVAVTLRAPNDWEDHRKLFETCFEKLKKENVKVRVPNCVPVVGGSRAQVKIEPKEKDFVLSFSENESLLKKTFLPRFVYAPVKKGDCLGSVAFFNGTALIKTVEILACDDVSENEPSFVEKKSFFKRLGEKIKNLFNI